jgi:tetratricopeptide (TPR) repeat protein
VVSIQDARVEALKAMLETDPKDAFALYGLAIEYKTSGDLEAALPLLEAATALPNPEVYAYYQLGEVLIALAENEEAEDALKTGIALAQDLGYEKAFNELRALLDTIID